MRHDTELAVFKVLMTTAILGGVAMFPLLMAGIQPWGVIAMVVCFGSMAANLLVFVLTW